MEIMNLYNSFKNNNELYNRVLNQHLFQKLRAKKEENSQEKCIEPRIFDPSTVSRINYLHDTDFNCMSGGRVACHMQ